MRECKHAHSIRDLNRNDVNNQLSIKVIGILDTSDLQFKFRKLTEIKKKNKKYSIFHF